MCFELVLRFSGLCAFVRNTNGKKARVLLVEAGSGSQNANGNNGHTQNGKGHLGLGKGTNGNGHLLHDEPHAAILGFDLRDMSPDNLRAPDMTLSDGQPRGVCFLKGYDLTVTQSGEDNLTFRKGLIGDRPDDNEVDLHSYDWLAALDEAQGGHRQSLDLQPGESLGELDPACFATDKNVHPAVAGRIALTSGTLETAQLSVNEKGWVKCQFVTGDDVAGGFNKPIATTMEWVLPVEDEEVRLEFKPFGSKVQSEPLILRPRPRPSRMKSRFHIKSEEEAITRIVAFVKNAPLADIRRERDPQCFISSVVRSRDHHFDHYYRLSRHSIEPGIGPVPRASGVHPFPPLQTDLPGSACIDCPCAKTQDHPHA